MKTKVQRLSLIHCVLLVHFVDAEFARGVVRNNVFTHYDRNTTGGSNDPLPGNNDVRPSVGYFRNNLNATMTTPIPYSTLAAIKPTTSVHMIVNHINKPQSPQWNRTQPIIAYTLPPNMKVQLDNIVRRVNPTSRPRSRTTKMSSATTPVYESTALNGIIIKNFIQHLSTTKADIESTIPNPNQFYATPSDTIDTEPLVIVNSNQFFPEGSMNTQHTQESIAQQTEDSNTPMLISNPTLPISHTSNQQNYVQNPNSLMHQISSYSPSTTYIPVNTSHKKGSHQATNSSLFSPIKRRRIPKPILLQQPPNTSINHKVVEAPSSIISQQSHDVPQSVTKPNYVNVPVILPQQNPYPIRLSNNNLENIHKTMLSQQSQSPVFLTSNQDYSVNVHSLNPMISQQAINQIKNQQPAKIAMQLAQNLPVQAIKIYNQTLASPSSIPTQDLSSNRPNNSLKQLQLQFLLDCNLLDPLTKTRIPLGTNPVGDDFFFTPMPFTNYNHPQAPVNLIQSPQISNNLNAFQTFNPVNLIPGFPVQTTPSPLTTMVLSEHTPTQTTHQSIQVSTRPSQNSRRRRRKKVKNVYVDLPIVSEVGNMLDKVYNFMEESLVTKVVKKTEKKPARKGSGGSYKIRTSVLPNNQASADAHGHMSNPNLAVRPFTESYDSSYEDDSHRYTTPYYRTTRARKRRPTKRRPSHAHYSNRLPYYDLHPNHYHRMKRTTLVPNYVTKNDGKKNYMTTKIHVTSEYNGPDPTDPIDYDNRRKATTTDSSEEDDYYYDSLTLDGLNIDTGSYEDDDDDDEDDDDDASESVQKEESSASAQSDDSKYKEISKIKNQKKKSRTKRKNSKQKADSASIENDYSYEDDKNDYYAPSMSMFGDFFGNVFSSMNKYVPSFGGYMPSFGGESGSKEMDYNSIEKEERSTTPKIETRNPKHPKYIFSDYTDYNAVDSPDVAESWYNPFNFGSNELTTTSAYSTTETSDYWNWFGSNEKLDSTEDSVTNQNNTGWFFGLFGNNDESNPTTTTTTRRPFLTIDNPMYKPNNWLGILASHLATNKPSNNTKPTSPQKISYDDYQLWRLSPESEDQLKFLEDYRTTPEGAKLQWWKGPTLRGPTDIVVPPTVIADVKMSLDYEDIPHEVVIWDLGKAIKFENPPMSRREKLEMELTQEHPMSFYRYHRYEDIVKFLEYLQRKFSDSVELIHIGRSFEGRSLIVAKISAPSTQGVNWKGKVTTSESKKKKKEKRRSIFIEAGTHAREWITPAVATWILDKIVKGLNNTDALGETVRSVDWYVMPMLNPDGYEHSHQYDRLWRKTRSKHEAEASILSNALSWLRKDKKDKDDDCYGTDLNRNWGHNWNEKGSSKSPCNEFYAGPKSFSEPEVKALSKFLEEHKKRLKIYLSLHSYGQIISYPSQANASYNSIKSDDLLEMAQVALETLRGIGSSTRYMVDNTNEMMYARSGSSDLYTLHDLGIKYSYTMELRDSGTHGFLLPPSNIESTAKETFEIIKGMVDYI